MENENKNPDPGHEINDFSVQEIAVKYEDQIKEKVFKTFGIEKQKLKVAHKDSIIKDGLCFFFVFDSAKRCYGVAFDIDVDGNILISRCGRLSMYDEN
jgi:hypothetical protein